MSFRTAFSDGHAAMTEYMLPTFFDRWFRQELAILQESFCLCKEPGRGHGGSTDHQSANLGRSEPCGNVVDIADVAIPDRRNGEDFGDFRDRLPISNARVPLFFGPSMHRNGGNSNTCQNRCG